MIRQYHAGVDHFRCRQIRGDCGAQDQRRNRDVAASEITELRVRAYEAITETHIVRGEN